MNYYKKITRHMNHYLPLLGIAIAGALGMIYFSYDKVFQASIAIAAAVSYVAWGAVHHYIHEDLDIAILFEYFIIAVLGLLIILSLIFNY